MGEIIGCPRTSRSNSAEIAEGVRQTSCSRNKCLGRLRRQDPFTKRSAKHLCQSNGIKIRVKWA